MKNVIIVHGCPSSEEKAMNPIMRTYDKHWIPWLKKNLEEKNLNVEVPLMLEPWRPDYEKFKEVFDNLEINEDSVLIGHSCGCAFLVRWLGDTKKKIKKLILVAPWKIADKEKFEDEELMESRKKFYNYEIKGDIKNNIKEIIIFTSDDEEEDGKKSAKIFHDSLGGKIIELKAHGHYCLGDMGTEEFPELLNEILKD